MDETATKIIDILKKHMKEPRDDIGLETALAVVLTDAGLSLDAALPLFSWQPAAIAGLADRHGRPIAPGEPANLAVFDPEHTWTVSGAESSSNSDNTPFEGRTFTGRVRHTIHAGEPVVIDFEATR